MAGGAAPIYTPVPQPVVTSAGSAWSTGIWCDMDTRAPGDRYAARTLMTTPSTPHAASPDAVRSLFPALQRRHNGSPVAYFDGPGGTQVPQSVVDAVSDYLLHHNANTH